MNVTYNPDPLTGFRLDQIYKDAIRQPIDGDPLQEDFKHWSYVHNWKEHFIKTVTHADGNYIIDATVPTPGDLRAFRRSDISGTTNATYSSNGIDLMAIKLFINEDSAAPGSATNEVKVAFMHGIPGSGGLPYLKNWSILMSNRPSTADYTLGLSGEFQDGFDARSTNMPTSNISVLGSAIDLELIDAINSGMRHDPSDHVIPGRMPLYPKDIRLKDNMNYLRNLFIR